MLSWLHGKILMNEFQNQKYRPARLPHKRLAGEIRLTAILALSLALWIGFLQAQHTLDRYEGFFFTLTLGCLLAEAYWLNGPRLETTRWHQQKSSEQQLELFTPENAFYTWRHEIRMLLHICLALTSLFMCFHLMPAENSLNTLLVLGFFVFSLIFLEWFTLEGIQHFDLAPYWGFLMLIAMGIGLLFGYFFYSLEHNMMLGLLATTIGTSTAVVIYLAKRVDVSEHVWSQVIGDLILQVLNTPHTQQDPELIVKLISSQLGYEHVSLLKVKAGNRDLQIVAECGTRLDVKGSTFSIDEGINGRAYRSRQTCAWNDVRFCPYYKRLLSSDLDQTQAEIAVPVSHQGQTLGVLDVQSSSALVFGPGDIRTLEIIAHILGAAWAAEKTDLLIGQGQKLWEQLTSEIHSENDVFETFAEFAQQNLGADLVVYYRLSPTGYPIRAPQVVGDLLSGERMNSAVQLLDSPLFGLIKSEFLVDHYNGPHILLCRIGTICKR